MNLIRKTAIAALVSVIALMFVGAIVRVTGAGMGCPDWPKCWGCLIPPTKIEQVDFQKLDIAKFQRKAARHGRDPGTITEEALRKEFNPVHVWTEFINRLFSLPVGFSTLFLFIVSSFAKQNRKLFVSCSFAAFFLVLLNAWMGARIVYSGLQPGTITTHMVLAIILQAILMYIIWRAAERPWQMNHSAPNANKLRWIGIALIGVTILEVIAGSQVRELTDEMAKSHIGQDRASWANELERTSLYLFHRSFSWAILILNIGLLYIVCFEERRKLNRVEILFSTIVFIQMFLGIVMSHFAIYRWVQVLHVGLASVMISLLVLWNLGARKREITYK